MHRSRLSTLVIDCQVDDIDAAATFWSQALGARVDVPADPADGHYRGLKSHDERLQLLVQKVDHPSRVHLDIETDDIDAEVNRLEALGAKRVAFVKRWWVMEAPTGHRFCVVRPQTKDLEQNGNAWI